MSTVWALEWRMAARRRRLLALNVAIPLVLVLPVALSAAPAAHAAAVYAVLFVLFGTFGAAIPLVRDAETGVLQRIRLTGIPPHRFLLERTAASALLDTLQLLPALIVIAAAGSVPPAAAAALPILLAAALLAANALGVLVAAAARSIAEAALFAAVAALFLLHGAGVFRTPAPGGFADALAGLIPFHYLHQALLQAAGAAPRVGPAAAVTVAAATAAPFLLLIAVLARPALTRLGRR